MFNMRNFILPVLTLVLLWACGGKESESNPMQATIDSLEMANSNQQSEIDYYLADFMEIQNVMDSVKSRQAIIASAGSSPELSSNTRANLAMMIAEASS